MTRPADEIVRELVRLVRERIGPIASFRQAAVVKRLPKTRSGKILRGTMKKIADGDPFTVPPTIDDPAILDEIRERLAGLGYPGGEPAERRGRDRPGVGWTGGGSR